MVAEAMVFVAKIGATVAAATGVPVLKMVFYLKKRKKSFKLRDQYVFNIYLDWNHIALTVKNVNF